MIVGDLFKSWLNRTTVEWFVFDDSVINFSDIRYT